MVILTAKPALKTIDVAATGPMDVGHRNYLSRKRNKMTSSRSRAYQIIEETKEAMEASFLFFFRSGTSVMNKVSKLTCVKTGNNITGNGKFFQLAS